MKLFSVVILMWCSRRAVSQSALGQYDQRYDYLDLDGILDSKRLVRNYVDCLINVKPCTPEGKALKRVLPEALRTKCARCSERQKRVAVKVIHRMKTEYPREWSMLAARWDPSGDFSAYFEHVLAKEHFNTIAGNEVRPGRRPVEPPRPTPPPQLEDLTPPPPSRTPPPTSTVTTPIPLIVNRFGDDDDDDQEIPMPMPSNNAQRPSTLAPAAADDQPRPTPIPWDSATPSPAPSNPTRFTFRPAMADMPLYATTVTLIDHLGNKIIRTTEFVADILRNTVKVLGG